MKLNIIAANTSQTGFDPIWLIIAVGVVIVIAAAIISNSQSKKRRADAKIYTELYSKGLPIEERLAKLESLKNKNLISQSEYEAQRIKVLNEI